ncbi:MAG: TlpA family protein disulfide reductase [Candidatus Acidiferrales bacterium]
MRTHLWVWIPALAVISFAVCSHSALKRDETAAAVPAGELGSALPEFSVKDFHGRRISSDSFRGKVVIVDFWATWCAPCKREMPGYQHLLDRYGSRGLAVVGFKATMMMDTEDPVRFAQKAGVHYPLAIASPEIVRKFGGLQGLPTTFLYDRKGTLRQKIIGFEYTHVVESDIGPLLGPK